MNRKGNGGNRYMVMQVTCEYHPEVVATDKCDRCRRPICLNDVMKYEVRREVGDDSSSYFYQIYNLCPLCYSMALEAEYSLKANIFKGSIALILFFIVAASLLFFSNVLSEFEAPIFFLGLTAILSVFSIIALAILYDIFVVGPKKVKKAQQIRENFLRSINWHKNHAKEKASIDSSNFTTMTLECFECGTPLDRTDKFCPNCGDPTDEERIGLKKR